jgi:hypothetical protein
METGTKPAPFGGSISVWEDQAPAGGANHAHYIYSRAQDQKKRQPTLARLEPGYGLASAYYAIRFTGTHNLLLATSETPADATDLRSTLQLLGSPQVTFAIVFRNSTLDLTHVFGTCYAAPQGKLTECWLFGMEKGAMWLSGNNPQNQVRVKLRVPDEFHIVVLSVDQKGRSGKFTVWDRQGKIGDSAQILGLPELNKVQRVRLGHHARQPGTNTFGLKGEILELGFYPKALKDDTIEEIFKNLNAKYFSKD